MNWFIWHVVTCWWTAAMYVRIWQPLKGGNTGSVYLAFCILSSIFWTLAFYIWTCFRGDRPPALFHCQKRHQSCGRKTARPSESPPLFFCPLIWRLPLRDNDSNPKCQSISVTRGEKKDFSTSPKRFVRSNGKQGCTWNKHFGYLTQIVLLQQQT